MITTKEIDFSTYKQIFKHLKLDTKNRLLVNILRLVKINETTYKLDFFERMINFIKVVGLEAFSNNMPIDATIKLNDENLSGINQSLIEFLYQFKIITLKNNVLTINQKYKRLIEEGIIKKLLKENKVDKTLTKKERKLANDFLFVKDLVTKYSNEEYKFQNIFNNASYWESLVVERKLDYEVRLCETLYNLIYLKIPGKIKSPFDEDYYTESGQNAFKNFTRFAFIDYLKKISNGNNSINVFDLGCGYGNYVEAVHNSFPNSTITGIELNPKVYSNTREKFEGIDSIEIINENFFDYTVGKKYDFILMNYVFFYFNSTEKKKVMEKAKSMLTDTGSIIICQYFSGIEDLKKRLAKKQKEYSLSRKIEMYYSDKILYANTLWNDAVDTFSEAVKWNEFQKTISELNLHIESMTNADKFYYSLFIELKKTS